MTNELIFSVRVDRQVDGRAGELAMQQTTESLSPKERDAMAMRQLVMRTFCDLLHATKLPPMVVLEYAAAALGSVYRETADAHARPHGCPCGWEPDEMRDIARLQKALVEEALSALGQHLALAPVMGHA
jgi:hypothetical protein